MRPVDTIHSITRVREMVVGANIDKVYMVMDFGGMDLKVGPIAVVTTRIFTTSLSRLSYCNRL